MIIYYKMIKEKDILIRVTEELKKKLQKEASSIGLSLSSYIRLTLIKHLNQEEKLNEA